MAKWRAHFKMFYREWLIGMMVAVIAFLMYQQVNVMPFVVIAGVILGVGYLAKHKGKLGISSDSRASHKRKPSSLTFQDIGGQDRAKQELIEALDFLIRYEDIARLGIRPLKGILLTGPPGTGKTLMAKAAAHYTNSAFVSASGSEFVEMYVGVGASRVRELFKEARTLARKENKTSAVLFIDEIDVIGGRREGGQHREYDQTLNQLLTEMDGMHTDEEPRLLIVAATNRKEMLDAALLRPGRFDRHIGVELPDKAGRMHILNLHGRNKPLHADADLEQVATESFGFSGAQLESLMNEAAIYAMRDGESTIEQRHLSLAIDKVMLGEKSDRTPSQQEKERVAIHELGHAIAAEVVKPGSVAQVSLSPRGQALGFVRHYPQHDQYLYTREDLESKIVIALGGAVAEEMFYGGRSTGSRNDFSQALDLVRTLVDSGLTSLGIVEAELLPPESYMRENEQILQEMSVRTRSILEEAREVFRQSLDILMREENLSGEQFRLLMKNGVVQPIAASSQ